MPVLTRRRCDVERAPRAAQAPLVGQRMSGVAPLGVRRKRLRRCCWRADSEQVAYRHVSSRGKRREHRRSRLARSDDVDGIGTSQRLGNIAGERPTNETSGVHSRQSFTKNGVEVISKRGNGGQFTCRGSAQAERPATRSTCWRTWLTT